MRTRLVALAVLALALPGNASNDVAAQPLATAALVAPATAPTRTATQFAPSAPRALTRTPLASAASTIPTAYPRATPPQAPRTPSRVAYPRATPKPGTRCTKLNAIAGPVACLKVRDRLVWTKRRTQRVTADLPVTAAVADGAIPVNARSSSGLRLTLKSATPATCRIAGTSVVPVTPGVCEVLFLQAGNARYLPVRASLTVTLLGSNTITFRLPPALALADGTVALTATATSGDPVTYTTATPTICTIDGTTLRLLASGTCTVTASQDATDTHLAAASVTVTTVINATRTAADITDAVQGYQIHAVYVVPSDGTDHHLDTNGNLATILTQGDQLLQQDIGRSVRIDSTSTGDDIGFLHTHFTTAQIQSSNSLPTDLLTEIGALDNPSPNRKDWIFFVDVPSFNGGEACGYAGLGGVTAVVALQGTCGQAAFGMQSIASITWLHEWFHNLGVEHTPSGTCDLMLPAPDCPLNGHMNIDVNHTGYVGSSAQGVDVLTLPVWSDPTLGTPGALGCDLTPANRASGQPFAYCSTGTQRIGTMQYCWTNLTSVSLQDETAAGTWAIVATGTGLTQPWGNSSWTCTDPGYTAPSAMVTQTSPGLHHYRWVSPSGQVLESFDVIWAQ